eukprot:55417_1
MKHHVEIVILLLEKLTIDVNTVSSTSNSVLMAACQNDNQTILRLLFEKPSLNLHAVNAEGETARMLATNGGVISMLDVEIARRQSEADTVLLGVWNSRLPSEITHMISK